METLHKDAKKIETIDAFMNAITDTITQKEKRQVYEDYKETVKSITPLDLFYVSMYHQKSKLSHDTIKKTANKFVNVFYEGLKEHELTTHHHDFFKALIEENKAIIHHLDGLKKFLKQGPIKESHIELLKGFEHCLEIERKFIKKENILFPVLEDRLPSTKPLEVMWSLHDDARVLIKKLIQALKSESIDESTIKKDIGTYYYLVYGIIQKEALILYPVASKLLEDDLLDRLYEECFEFGFTFIEKEPPHNKEESLKTLEGEFTVKNGALSFEQLDLLLNHLPLDITFVDKNDKVRYFNVTNNRHFPRNPSIIGRKVEHCHPPKSVDTVKRIVEAFKKGEKDTAEFWIQFKGHFLYITYYAVRDKDGHFAGVLEASQDVTRIKELTGEQRLLDWE